MGQTSCMSEVATAIWATQPMLRSSVGGILSVPQVAHNGSSFANLRLLFDSFAKEGPFRWRLIQSQISIKDLVCIYFLLGIQEFQKLAGD